MPSLNFLRPLIRWFNFLPVWRWGRVGVWGLSLRAPTFDRWLCLSLHRFGMMGRADRAFLLTHVRPGMTVVDVGANQGLYTLLFAQRVGPTGRVIAFEPDDMLHAAAKENISHHHASNVHLHHCALGSTVGSMTLYRSLLNSGDNRLTPNSRENGPRQEIQVRVETLDGMLAGQRVDFIKIDVQGWEMEVFRGMERLLDDPRNADTAIFFEYWPQGLIDAGDDRMEPLTFLTRKKFTLFQVIDARLEAITDVIEFAGKVEAGTYRNLYAIRRRTP